MSDWRSTAHSALVEERLPENVARCHLSPRNCVMREGQRGFCGVRMNQDGRLVTLNYGKSVHITDETIETEAVNHFLPGQRILSLGNLGCMLDCKYCHNWKTSQARYVDDKDAYYYTPEGVVETALRHGIRCLSWTYNDPVVWQEFVIDTARLAQQEGLINLYKSAFFISPEAIDQLIPYIDIFSVSVKCIDLEFYRTITTGWLQPVPDGAVQVYRAGRHLEISNLMVIDINDDEENARRIADWALEDRPEVHYPDVDGSQLTAYGGILFFRLAEGLTYNPLCRRADIVRDRYGHGRGHVDRGPTVYRQPCVHDPGRESGERVGDRSRPALLRLGTSRRPESRPAPGIRASQSRRRLRTSRIRAAARLT